MAEFNHSISDLKLRDSDGAAAAVRPTGNRSRSRVERARDEGVWTAALFLSFVSALMPAWFLGSGLAMSSGHGPDASVNSHAFQIVMIGLGAVAVWFGARVSLLIARAPRLSRGNHRTTLQRLPLVACVMSILMLHRFVYNHDGLSVDALAYIGAIAPAFMMAALSFALPAITKHRHGAGIGAAGGLAWLAAGVATVAVGMLGEGWWVPAACAAVGAYCTGVASVRVWHRYEGEVVTA